ncbi:hypothetical protein GCM10022253_30990 [Sphingomonas endophytica]|uniref:Fe/B12 periplasmic-binding domain-containing protein n=1 Tax=Sphingomonas endophytica TaxID=869719 RepID=A0ABR6N7M5_9SPHN|nr:hypothetical protein [Sphingomonas endophytica]MBB5726534.1 hypothetical protein [Sphingomonas endophytica]
MPYGKGDEHPPAVLPLDLGGGRIAIYASGTTDTLDKTGVPPAGVDGKAVDDILYKKGAIPQFLYAENPLSRAASCSGGGVRRRQGRGNRVAIRSW